MPRQRRPPHATLTVSACCASSDQVARERRDHAGAELDPWDLPPGERQRRQRVVPEDLRRPVGAEAAGLGAAHLADHLVDGALVEGSPEDPDPHETAR